jgi:hypothetical protein
VRAVIVGVAGAALLAAGLLVQAPAALVDARLAAATGNRVRLTEATGTVWAGNGTLRIGDAAVGPRVAWRIEALPLLSGTLAMTVGAEGGEVMATTLRVSGSRAELRGLDFVAVPAGALARSFAPGFPAIGGRLRIDVPELVVDATTITGQMRLAWNDATLPASAAAPPVLLGTITLPLAARDGALAGQVGNAGGEVAVAGAVEWHARGAARVDVTLAARADVGRERQEAVAATLARIGVADGQGGYRIAFTSPGP